MNRFLLLLCISLLTSCISVKKYNERLETPVSVDKLRYDIDFVYKKLQQLHPELYWYVTKGKLDSAFANVKTDINSPLKAWDFYEKLAPAIKEVRQGHLVLRPPARKYTAQEIKKLKNQKGLFSRFEYVFDNDRLYVTKNSDSIYNMEIGSQILKINDQSVKEILSKYQRFITSDGYNTTYQKYALARQWPIYFTLQHGILDSAKIETLYENKPKSFYLHRESLTKKDKLEIKAETKKNRIQKNKDYNSDSKNFNRDLEFKSADSSVAVMKIRSFSGKKSRNFYRESFRTLKNAKIKDLIIDVRDNLGGSVAEITHLYSFLGANQFPFIEDIEINSRKALFSADYYSGLSNLVKPVAFAVYPLYSAGLLASAKTKNGKTYLKNNTFSRKKPQADSYYGNLYLLINGSSFSASSILASKLKSDGRAYLIGEETGGANDGNIAGRYATVKLPNSKLYLPIGIMLIKPNIKPANTFKGVEPDFAIVPDLSDIIVENDPVMDFVLQKIGSKKNE